MQFSRVVVARISELGVMDRFVLSTVKTVLMNRSGRMVVLIYFLTMHLLVFVTLYHWSHSQVCEPTATDLLPGQMEQFNGAI